MTLKELVRPNIWNLKPYTCARDEFSGEAQAWLDANENSIITDYNRYPDPLQREVKTLIGQYRGIDPQNIFLGVVAMSASILPIACFANPALTM